MVSHSARDEMTLRQRLAAERVARGWSVLDVAKRIGASAAVIRQLECDEAVGLAGVYRDAYLKRYLDLMGFEDSVGGSNLPQLQVVLPMPKRRRWLEKTMGWARYALASLSLIIVPPLVWFSINHSASWITGELGESSGWASVQTLAPNVRLLNASQLPVRSLGGSTQDSSDQSSAVRADSFNPDVATTDGPVVVVNVLKVQLLEDSWLELRDSEGKRLEHNLLRADAQYSYQGEPPFEVLVGLGSAVQFQLNGQVVEHLDSDSAEGLMEFQIDASGGVTRKQ